MLILQNRHFMPVSDGRIFTQFITAGKRAIRRTIAVRQTDVSDEVCYK